MSTPTRPLAVAFLTLGLFCHPVAGQPTEPDSRWRELAQAWRPNGLAVAGLTFQEADTAQQTPEVGPRRARGALWGAGIGLVAGGILGGLTVGSDDDGFGEGLVEASATGEAVLLGAITGAAVGALLGATVFAPSGVARTWTSGARGPVVIPVFGPVAPGLSVRMQLPAR